MAVRKDQVRKLEALRDQLKSQLAELQARIVGVEMAIRAVSGEAEPTQVRRARAPRSNVKQAVLELLELAKSDGLNASRAVEAAEERGQKLERGTVSSLLSRLKNEGLVTYDGTVYRLKKYATQNQAPLGPPMH